MIPGDYLQKFLYKPSTSLSPYKADEHMFVSEEWVNKMIKKHSNVMSFWKDNKVNYKINSKGFRSDFNFYPNKSLKVDIYLGCSITFGQEHIWENTWPYLVSKDTGNTIINLGIPGSGIERGFFDLSKYIDYYDVQNVFHFQPFYARYAYVSEDPKNAGQGEYLYYDTSILSSENDFSIVPWNKSYMYNVLAGNEFLCYTYYKNIYAIKGICSKKNIPYYFFTNQKEEFPEECVLLYNKKKDIYYWMDNVDDPTRIPARDLLHPPSTFMKKLSEHFVNLKEKYPSGFIPEFENIETANVF